MLAKDRLDVGLFVGDVDASIAFYGDVLGARVEGVLPVGRGHVQHRLGLRGSVLKLNVVRSELAAAPSGYRRLLVAGAPEATDPDGVAIGPAAGDGIGIVVEVDDDVAERAFLRDGLGATSDPDGGQRFGTTTVAVAHRPGRVDPGPLAARGFRYLTIQVDDVVVAHERAVRAGARVDLPPTRLGDVAAIAMVRSPGGNAWELSQRHDLAGPLPDL